MGKYYSFKYDYDCLPKSKDNFRNALMRIGEKDPKRIRKTSLNGRKPDQNEELSDKKLVNRGILNVRKELNRHLGKNGKYSNRMIKFCSEVAFVETNEKAIWLKAKIPHEAYSEIIRAAYKLLEDCDIAYCKNLFETEKHDKYIYQDFYSNEMFKTTAPIQTNMIIRTFKGNTEEIVTYANEFRKNIGGKKQNG